MPAFTTDILDAADINAILASAAAAMRWRSAPRFRRWSVSLTPM